MSEAKDNGEPVTEKWLRSFGFLPGDERPIELGRTIYGRGGDGYRDDEPAMHVVWSSRDSSWWLEAYGVAGESLASVELEPKPTRGEVLALLTALGIKAGEGP